MAKIRLETILVPIDFSEFSSKALRYAIALAEQFGSRILLLAVIETPLPTGDLGNLSSTLLNWEKEGINQTAAKLALLAAQSIHGPNYLCFTRVGEPTEEILALAKEHGADLIVMGTHGRTGVKHMFLGSVAEKTVRCSPCPVLIVRLMQREFVCETAAGPRVELLEIILPIDFSKGASHAIEWADAMAKKSGGARLNLLHVVPYHYALGEYDALVYPQLEAEMVETGRRRMAMLAKREQERGIEVHWAVLRGTPRHEIIQFAQQQKGDIVVMGTRGLTGLKHLLLGSTAEYVMRHAPCAVLAVPSPKRSPRRKKVAEPDLATV